MIKYRVTYTHRGRHPETKIVNKEWVKNFLKSGVGPDTETIMRHPTVEELAGLVYRRPNNLTSRLIPTPLVSFSIVHSTVPRGIAGLMRAMTFSARRQDLPYSGTPEEWANIPWEWTASNFPGHESVEGGTASGAELYNIFYSFFGEIPEPPITAAPAPTPAPAPAPAPTPAPAPAENNILNLIGGKRKVARSKRRSTKRVNHAKRAKRSTRRH